MVNSGKQKNIKKSGDKIGKSKIGYDPLAWITQEDAAALSDNSHVVEQQLQSPEESGNSSVITLSERSEDSIMILELPVNFGIAQVAQVYEQARQLMEGEAGSVEIRAGEVESVDAAALQLLLAIIQQAESAEKQVIWQSLSEKVVAGAGLLGLRAMLKLG